MIICITSLDIMDQIRNKGFALTSTKGTGINETKNILFITIPRRKKQVLIETLRKLDNDCYIIIENATI